MLGRGVALFLVLSCLASTPASRDVPSPRQQPSSRVARPPGAPGLPGRGAPMPGRVSGATTSEATRSVVEAASATAVADSLPGTDVECRDFRSGLALTIQAQRLLADGTVAQDWTPERSRFCLGTAQGVASVAIADYAGGVIVVWVDDRMGDGDLYAQRFSGPDSIAAGWPGDGVPVCVARGSQYGVSMATDGAGGAIVAWTDFRGGGQGDIYAQRITSAGELAWGTDGVPVCVNRASQAGPAVATDGNGGALVIWQDGRGADRDLYVQHLTSGGESVAGATSGGTALITATGAQQSPTLTDDGQGGAVLVWEDRRGSKPELYALRLDGQGQAAAGWPAQGVAITAAMGRPRWPVVVKDGAQGAIVAWCDSTGLYAQRVTAAGSLAWSPSGVCLRAAEGAFSHPAIVSDSTGGAIVAWDDPRGSTSDIYAQRVTGAGVVAWGEGGVPVCLAAGEQYSVSLSSDGAGGALATWVDSRADEAAVYLAGRAMQAGTAPKLEGIEVGPGRAKLTWRTTKGDARSFRFRRRLGEGEWTVLGELTAQDDGSLVGEDRTVPAGKQAQYGLAVKVGSSAEVQLAIVSVDIPLPKPLALRFARCEEGGRVVRVALTLETDDAARLDLFDVAGRRMMTRDVGTLGAGDHEVRLTLPGHARPGVYFLRLRQNQVTRSDRVTVLQ
jgi:hypothetical protein